jgi:glycosyltransferase involved in cell wall biosynthesis
MPSGIAGIDQNGTMPMRRLVVLTPFAVVPPRHGPQVRVAGILSNLGSGWEVVHFTQSIQRTDLPFPPAAVRGGPHWVEHRLRDPLSAAWLIGLSKIGGYPAAYADRLLALAPRRQVRSELARADVVFISSHYQFPWVRRHTPATTSVVVDCYCIEHQVWPARRARWTRAVNREMERGAKAAWAQADAVFATREEEAEIISAVGARRVEIIRNGADISRFRPVAGDAERASERHRLGIPQDEAIAIFVGAAGYGNVHAMTPLERHATAYARAGIRVYVVGRAGIGRRAVPNIVWVGEVDDVAPWLRAADIAICPLYDEGGTNGTSIKSVEYMAAGLPIVSTPAGLRGLPVRDGIEAVICNHDEMPAHAAQLIADPGRRRELGAAARRVAEEHLSWTSIGRRASEILDELAVRRASLAGAP